MNDPDAKEADFNYNHIDIARFCAHDTIRAACNFDYAYSEKDKNMQIKKADFTKVMKSVEKTFENWEGNFSPLTVYGVFFDRIEPLLKNAVDEITAHGASIAFAGMNDTYVPGIASGNIYEIFAHADRPHPESEGEAPGFCLTTEEISMFRDMALRVSATKDGQEKSYQFALTPDRWTFPRKARRKLLATLNMGLSALAQGQR